MSKERTRLVRWEDSSVTALAAKGRTGIAYLRAIADGTVPPAPIQLTLGFELTSVEEGQVEFRLIPGEYLCNPMGAVHGGVACTLLDSAMSCAVLSTLDEKHAFTTVDLTVHLTRAISPESGPLIAVGKLVHRGSRIVTAEGRLVDEQGRLFAHATTTCLVLERSQVERQMSASTR
jgi:uncharacterized protein (TIGR00369 family)